MIELIKKNINLFCLLGLLVGLAFFLFIYQTIDGFNVTGLTDVVPWGIYVVNFTFCLGLGAGILILLSIISREGNVSYEYKFFLSLVAFIVLSLAGIFILADLGRIDRFYYMVIYAQIKSPLFWDFVSLNILIGISVAFCLAMLRQIFIARDFSSNTSRIEQLLYKILTKRKGLAVSDFYRKKGSWILVCLIIGLYLLTTELFAGLKARPQWHTPLLSLNFLISAVLSGVAAVVLLGNYYYNLLKKDRDLFLNSGRRFLLILLIADLFVILVKHVMDKINPLLADVRTLFPYSLFIFLVLGNIIPIYLIFTNKNDKNILCRYVPVLILFGMLLKRADILIPAYFQRWLPFAPEAFYAPSLTEIFVLLGIYSAGIIAVIIVFYFTLLLAEKDR